ncbi:MAG: hypothetical protein QXT13_09475 [Pyrobaculum sp.]
MGSIYIVTPASVYTGGPTALYYLCHYLKKYSDMNVLIAFRGVIEGKNPVHPNYEQFKCDWIPLDEIKDKSENICIVPEIYPDLLHRYRRLKKIIYWLAVDNFFFSRIFRSKLSALVAAIKNPGVLKYGFPSRKKVNDWLSYFAHIEILKAQKNKSIKKLIQIADFHIAQSKYAYQFLSRLDVSHEKIYILREPIEDDFLNKEIDFSKKENLVTYNARKAFSIVNEILAKLSTQRRDIKVIPLKNVGKTGMIDILSRSKVFIDIGIHPGADRPPREAAVLGNVVVVNRHGGCQYFEDCPIPDPYIRNCNDLACTDLDTNTEVEQFIDYIENFDIHIQKFKYFVEYVKNQKVKYLDAIQELSQVLKSL